MNFYCKRKVTVAFTLLGLAVMLSFLSNLGTSEVFVNSSRKLPIYCVDSRTKKVALTFDAGYAKDSTDEILKILDKYNIKASFFPVGCWVDYNEDKLKVMHEKGHDIGNHTNNHPDMTKVTKERMIKEMAELDAKIRRITGQGTKLFRCPSGEYNDLVIDTAEKCGYYCIQWDVDSIDWRGEGIEKEYNRVIKNVKPGSIILFHNDGKYTTKTLPMVIEKLKADGYEFVKVSELIYKDNYMIDYSGKQIPLKN